MKLVMFRNLCIALKLISTIAYTQCIFRFGDKFSFYGVQLVAYNKIVHSYRCQLADTILIIIVPRDLTMLLNVCLSLKNILCI